MQTIFVLFGSESNNAADLADRTAFALKKAGFEAEVVDMSSFDVAQLDSLETALVVTSTYGNGNPPSNAEALHGALMARRAPLPNLRFSVCALGDTTYDRFAQCGKDFDDKLGELGATRIVPRQDCDVDYEEPWQAWLDAVIAAVKAAPASSARSAGTNAAVPAPPASSARVAAAPGTRKNPLHARVLRKRALSAEGSDKETLHVELALDSGLSYVCGDSLGIFCENDPALVADVLSAMKATGEESVALRGAVHEGAHGGGAMTLREALSRHLDLQHVDARLFAAMGLPKSADVHVVDLAQMKTETPELQAFVECLRPLAPRPYSIASSPRAHPGEAHLTVDVVRYEMRRRKRAGVASSMLADRAPPGTELEAYVLPAPHFRLPASGEVPIVMIGPGTGVAPYRAFLEERELSGAKGRSWLFFGTRHARDRFYNDELDAMRARGALTRFDCAYSRDQAERVYVQHKMREHAAELYAWVQDGAHLYVCGEAQRMATDVQAALLDILAVGASASRERALESLRALESAGRYCKDVY